MGYDFLDSFVDSLSDGVEPTATLGVEPTATLAEPTEEYGELDDFVNSLVDTPPEHPELMERQIPESGPETSVLGVAKALGRGVVEGVSTGIPEMIGSAGEFIGSKTGLETLEGHGQTLKEWSKYKAEEWFGVQPDRSTIEEMVYQGGLMLGPSVIPGGAAVGGTRLLFGVGRLSKAARLSRLSGNFVKAEQIAAKAKAAAKLSTNLGSASNAVVLFGASQAQNTIDNATYTAKQLRMVGDEEGARKAEAAAEGSAPYVTGAIEALGEYFGTKYLSKLFRLDEGEIIRRGAYQLGKDWLKTLGVEVTTEVGQSGSQAYVEKKTGIRPSADPLKEAIDVVGPTFVMTLLTGGLSAGANLLSSPEQIVLPPSTGSVLDEGAADLEEATRPDDFDQGIAAEQSMVARQALGEGLTAGRIAAEQEGLLEPIVKDTRTQEQILDQSTAKYVNEEEKRAAEQEFEAYQPAVPGAPVPKIPEQILDETITKLEAPAEEAQTVPEKLTEAVGKPEQIATLEQGGITGEQAQIQAIVRDAVGQKVDIAEALEGKGKTEAAAKLRAEALKNGNALKDADGLVTEKAVNKALGYAEPVDSAAHEAAGTPVTEEAPATTAKKEGIKKKIDAFFGTGAPSEQQVRSMKLQHEALTQELKREDLQDTDRTFYEEKKAKIEGILEKVDKPQFSLRRRVKQGPQISFKQTAAGSGVYESENGLYRIKKRFVGSNQGTTGPNKEFGWGYEKKQEDGSWVSSEGGYGTLKKAQEYISDRWNNYESPEAQQKRKPQFSKKKPEAKPLSAPGIEKSLPGSKIITRGDHFLVELPNGISLKIVGGNIEFDHAKFKAEYGRDARPQEITSGRWKRLTGKTGLMVLAKHATGKTLDNETFQAAVEMVLTPKEVAGLISEHGDIKKARRAYMHWDGKVDNGLFTKIMNFFRAIIGAAPTAEQTFEKVKSGEVWNRSKIKAQESVAVGPQFSKKKKVVKYPVHKPPKTSAGKFLGAPEWLKTAHHYLKLKQQINQFAAEGVVGRYWYENSVKGILKITKGNIVEAEKLIQLIAIYSPQMMPFANTMMAVKAYNHWKTGGKRFSSVTKGGRKEDMHVKTAKQDEKARGVLYDNVPFDGRKTNSFYINLMSEILETSTDINLAELQLTKRDAETWTTHPTTVDMWMARAFGYESDIVPGDKGSGKYSFIENEVNRIANELNENLAPNEEPWKPHQVQAAIWAGMRTRATMPATVIATREESVKKGFSTYLNPKTKTKWRTSSKAADKREHGKIWRKHSLKVSSADVMTVLANSGEDSFADALSRMTESVTWEANPSKSLDHDIFGASDRVKKMFTREAMGLIIDEDGTDLLAEFLGVPFSWSALSTGAYEGNINTNVVTNLLPEKGAGKFSRDQVAKYARIIQYIFKQDAVPWFRPDPNMSRVGTYAVHKKGSNKATRRFDTLEEARKYAAKGEYEVRGKQEALGIQVIFTKKLTKDSEREFFARLKLQLGPNAGYTKISGREVNILNYRDENGIPLNLKENTDKGKEVNGRTDEQVRDGINKLFLGGKAGIAKFDEFTAENDYGHHQSWREDPLGRNVPWRSGLEGSPDLQAWVRGRSNQFEQLLERYSGKNLKSREQEAKQLGTLQREQQAVKPQGNLLAPAYWLSPDGDVLEVPSLRSDIRHIYAINANPEAFGETQKSLDDTLIEVNKSRKERGLKPEPAGVEGESRNTVMARVINRGFIRIRENKNNWTVQVDKLNAAAVKSIQRWSSMIVRLGKDRQYDDVNIHDLSTNGHQRVSMNRISTMKPVQFSKGSKSTGKSTVEKITLAITEKLHAKGVRNLIDSGLVKIVQTQEELKVESSAVVFSEGDVIHGMYHNGTAYIVADNVLDKDAYGLLLHELGVHYSFDNGIFGKGAPLGAQKGQEILKRFQALKSTSENSKTAQAVQEAYNKIPDDVAPAKTDEEALGYFLEENKNRDLGLYRRIIATIKAWAFNLGLDTKYITTDDMVVMVEKAVRREAGVDRRQPSVAGELQPAFSDSPIWRSQMMQHFRDKLPGKGPAKQIFTTIKSWVKKGQVKAEEVEWSGIYEWLADQEGTVKKDDVLTWLAANRVQMEERVYGESLEYTLNEIETQLQDDGVAKFYYEGKLNEARYGKDDEGDSVVVVEKVESGYKENFMDVEAILDEYPGASIGEDVAAKYADHQIPGGTNYKELLLKLPLKTGKEKRYWVLQDGAPYSNKHHETFEQAEEERRRAVSAQEERRRALSAHHYIERKLEVKESPGVTVADRSATYRTDHYPNDFNILVHIRFNERVDASGKKVLFIEELQSDWHQEGRKEGYKKKRAIKRITFSEFKKEENGWAETVKSSAKLNAKKTLTGKSPVWVTRDAITGKIHSVDWVSREVAEANSPALGGTVPDAPFKKTSAWQSLALRRMIRYAAENGFNRIAWTTGEQQADRYDLSKQVDRIEYKLNDDGTADFSAIGNEDFAELVGREGATKEEVADTLGKEVADSMFNDVGIEDESFPEGFKALTEEDLKVGGEAMSKFYDKMLPAAANKMIKKWGAKVGSVSLDTHEYGNADETEKLYAQGRIDKKERDIRIGHQLFDVNGFDITTKMHDAAMAGLPQFSKSSAPVEHPMYESFTDVNKSIHERQKSIEGYIRKKIEPADRGKVMSLIKKQAIWKKPKTQRAHFETAIGLIDGKSAEFAERTQKAKNQAEIDKLLKTSKVKKGKGTMTPEAQDQVEAIRKVRKMRKSDVDAKLLKLTEAAIATDNSKENDFIIDPELEEEILILSMYGKGADARSVQLGVDNLRTLVTAGKMISMVKKELLAEMHQERAETGAKEFSAPGDPKEVKRDREIREKTLRGKIAKTMDDIMFNHQRFSWLLDSFSRYDKKSGTMKGKTTTHFNEVAYGSSQKYTTLITKLQEQKAETLKDIYGAKNAWQLYQKTKKNTKIISREKTGVNRHYEDGTSSKMALSQNEAYKLWQWLYAAYNGDTQLRENLESNGYNKKTMDELEDFMTDEVRAWAEWQIHVFYPKVYEISNPVHEELYGISMAQNAFYTPIVRDYARGKEDDALLNMSTNHGTIRNGALEQRVKTNLDVRMVDGDMLMDQHMMQMVHFTSWGVAMREMRAVLGSSKVQGALNATYGNFAQGVLNNFMDDFARGGVDRSKNLQLLDKLRVAFTTSVIGANPVTMIKQLTSIPAVLMDTPADVVAKGMIDALMHPMKVVKTLKNTQHIKNRYAEGWERDIKTAMRAGNPYGLGNIVNALMLPTRIGDAAAIFFGGWGVYKNAYDTAITEGKTKEAAEKIANKQFGMTMDLTQQSAQVQDMAKVQRLGSLGKLFTMFMTTPIAYYQQWEGGMRNLRHGRGSKTENIKRMAIAWFVLPIVFAWVSAGGDPEDEELQKAALFGVTNGLFIGRDILGVIGDGLFTGDFFPPSTAPPISEFAKNAGRLSVMAHKMLKGEAGDVEDIQKTLKLAYTITGQLTGVPTGPVRRIAKGWTDPNARLEQKFGFSEYVAKKGTAVNDADERRKTIMKVDRQIKKYTKERKRVKLTEYRKKRKKLVRLIEATKMYAEQDRALKKRLETATGEKKKNLTQRRDTMAKRYLKRTDKAF